MYNIYICIYINTTFYFTQGIIIYWQARARHPVHARVVSLSPINVNQILTRAQRKSKNKKNVFLRTHTREKTNWFIALRLQCPHTNKKKNKNLFRPTWVSLRIFFFVKQNYWVHMHTCTQFLAALDIFLITLCQNNLFILIPKIALSFLSPRHVNAHPIKNFKYRIYYVSQFFKLLFIPHTYFKYIYLKKGFYTNKINL